MKISKQNIIIYGIRIVLSIVLIFGVSYFSFQWGVYSGKNTNYSPSFSIEKFNRNQVLSLHDQLQKGERKLHMYGFTYCAIYDLDTEHLEMIRQPRDWKDFQNEQPSAWQMYWAEHPFKGLHFTLHDIKKIYDLTNNIQTNKKFGIFVSTIGYIGYKQGKDLGMAISYLDFLTEHPDFFEIEDRYANALSDVTFWKQLVERVNSI